MFKLLNTKTNGFEYFTPKGLLDNLNHDRSEGWKHYTMEDTLKTIIEAIETFTEYTTKF